MVEELEHSAAESPFPEARVVAPGAPWRWLAAGLADMRAAPGASLFYGAFFAAMGAALMFFVNSAAVELALVTGFLLVAPFLSVGLYDLSRRRERGEEPQLAATITAWQANAPALGFYALILALLLAVWIRVSVVVVALFFSSGAPLEHGVLAELASSVDGWIFMVAYAAAGSGFALLVFATSVVSIPMLLDRKDMDTITAMIASFSVLRRNFALMLLWGAIIVALVAAGFFAYFVGLAITVPLIGHATWHAYRESVA
jgi:uncharacterized membrane protein